MTKPIVATTDPTTTGGMNFLKTVSTLDAPKTPSIMPPAKAAPHAVVSPKGYVLAIEAIFTKMGTEGN